MDEVPSGRDTLRRIRVLIADDHTVERRELRDTIDAAADFEIVGEADDGVLALQLARWLRPNVVLLDDDMPLLRGAEVAQVLARELPEVEVVLLTAGDLQESA